MTAARETTPPAPATVGPFVTVAALAMAAFDAGRAAAGIGRPALLTGVLLALWGVVLVRSLYRMVRTHRPPADAVLLAGASIMPLTLVLAPSLPGGIL